MAAHDPKQIWFNREINQRLEEVLRSIAASHLNLVENGMRFQKLKQDRNILRLANGIVIDSSISFGRQTSRIYVPPVVVKKKEGEDKYLTLIITREYDDEPLTPSNMYYSYALRHGTVQGYLRIYRAVFNKETGVHEAGQIVFSCGGTIDGSRAGWRHKDGSDIWMFKNSQYPWTGIYNEAQNTWTFRIPYDESEPDGGIYFVVAKFNDKSLLTVYPRVYKYNEQWAIKPDTIEYYYDPEVKDACKAISPREAPYYMTVPYYEIETVNRTNTFGNLATAQIPPPIKTYRTIKTTVPICNAVKVGPVGDGSATYKCDEFITPYGVLGDPDPYDFTWSCAYLRSNQYFSQSGTEEGYLDYDETMTCENLEASTDVAYIDVFDGSNSEGFEFAYNRLMNHHNGTLQRGTEFVNISGWLNPPDPVEREGQPPYREILEIESYVSVQGMPNTFPFATTSANHPVIVHSNWIDWGGFFADPVPGTILFYYMSFGDGKYHAPLSCENAGRTAMLSLDIPTRFGTIYDEVDLPYIV